MDQHLIQLLFVLYSSIIEQLTETVMSPNPELTKLVDKIIHISTLSRSQKVQQITQISIELLLDLLQCRDLIRYIEYNQDFMQEITQLVLRIEYAEFGPRVELNTGSEKGQVYLLLAGSVEKLKINCLKRRGSKVISKSFLAPRIKAEDGHYPLVKLMASELGYCIGSIVCLKFPMWVYSQFVTFLLKYQKDQMNQFLSQWLQISLREANHLKIFEKSKIEKVYKTQKLQIKKGEMYLLRSGEVARKQYPDSNQESVPLTSILTTGGFIFSDLESASTTFTASSIVYLVILDEKLTLSLFQHIDNYEKEFLKFYNCNKRNRQAFCIKTAYNTRYSEAECFLPLRYTEVKLKGAKATKRFHKSIEDIENFSNSKERNFLSNYPYQKLMESKENIFTRIKINKKKCEKVVLYLKKNQLKKKQTDAKMMQLKLKSITEKQFNITAKKQIFQAKNSKIKNGLFDDFGRQIRITEDGNEDNDQKNEEIYLSNDDTGIINGMAKESHVYQRQLNFLINVAEKKKKQRCNTQFNLKSSALIQYKMRHMRNKSLSKLKVISCQDGSQKLQSQLFNNFVQNKHTEKQTFPIKKARLKQTKAGRIKVIHQSAQVN